MLKRLMLLPIAALAALAAGCGEGGGEPRTAATERTSSPTALVEVGSEPAPRPAATADPLAGIRIKSVSSAYGTVVSDGKGEALYLFDREQGKRPRCYGTCAEVWPPVLAKGRPEAGRGAEQKLLGTTRRADGKWQVTYAGHPLYYYVSDSPGNILCHDVAEFGGTWLVVEPSGSGAG